MPRAAAPKASLSRAMRLRSRVTMDSTVSRPSRARRAAHARAEPWISSGLSATTTASRPGGSAAESFFTASGPPLRGGRHSAVRTSRPEVSAWPNLVFVVVIAGIHFLVRLLGRFGHGPVCKGLGARPSRACISPSRMAATRASPASAVQAGTGLPAPSAMSSAAVPGRWKSIKRSASQPDLIEDGAEVVHPAGTALAAFQVVAVVLLASDRADHVGAGLEGLQNVLRLNPPRAGHQHFPHRERPVEVRDGGTRPAGGVRRLARAGAVGAYEGRDGYGGSGGAGFLHGFHLSEQEMQDSTFSVLGNQNFCACNIRLSDAKLRL